MWAKFVSIEHCKVPGLRQKVQELQAGGVGLALGTFGIFWDLWDLFGSLRGTHDDVCFAMLCFCYHSFVDCFCGRKRPYEMRGSGRARDLQ